MNYSKYLPLALTVLLVGCTVPSISQTRMFVSGTPSIKGVITDQARMMISVTREKAAYSVQVPVASFDNIDFTLSNPTLLSQDLTANKPMSGSGTSNQVFTALRPGPGYSLDLELKLGTARAGMSHVSPIQLIAGETNHVTVVVGIDGRIDVTQSSAKNHTGTAGAWIIAKGDTIALDTGFGTLNSTQITNAKAETLRVKLSPELYADGAVVVSESIPANFDQFTWNTATSTATYDPTKLMLNVAGTITFEILDEHGAIIGRSELRNVTIQQGQGVDIEIIEGSDSLPG